jgi:3D (Asp-Asp-Asp) domain-containing protein
VVRVTVDSFNRIAGIVLLTVIATGCAERSARRKPPSVTRAATAERFTATAYCTGTKTATGSRPNEATIAADPNVLPMGSKVRLSGLQKRYNRVYIVADTGGSIRGRRIDLYMPDCREAIAFGRRSVSVSLIH